MENWLHGTCFFGKSAKIFRIAFYGLLLTTASFHFNVRQLNIYAKITVAGNSSKQPSIINLKKRNT